ncbi:hypothetical protein GWK47_048098 [Chionoecetes opilio]|uniref:Uncharacterized protein n=1 Tax=Chionoecetes opilio TaxID=41210 RepID=A0A8J4YAK6_CHIOP|nr:hypothetical protein GWK47_048098 [Chionoecetes opilio]
MPQGRLPRTSSSTHLLSKRGPVSDDHRLDPPRQDRNVIPVCCPRRVWTWSVTGGSRGRRGGRLGRHREHRTLRILQAASSLQPTSVVRASHPASGEEQRSRVTIASRPYNATLPQVCFGGRRQTWTLRRGLGGPVVPDLQKNS